MSRLSFGSPLRPKIQNAKRYLSLQVSQASHVLSDELNNILKSSKTCGKKRRRIIDEIFSTEQSYQDHLHLITTLFLSPLREISLLPDVILNVIFSNIEAIQNVNRELLVHMETMGIGDAFLALAPFLKLYSTYANNFEKALSTIKDWEKKCPKFAAFKEQQENLEEAKGLKLNALLITPIQRVPRYKMLLENLLWKTPDDHADFTKLKEAVDQISSVALHINENIRQHENFQKMLSIQNSFGREGAPKLTAPGRVFLKEGTLLKVFPLQQCKVQEVMGNGANREGGVLFSVSTVLLQKSKIECEDKSLLLFSKSQGEAKSWLNEIRNAIESMQEPGPSHQEPRRAACNNSRRGIKRMPARKTNERKQNSGHSVASLTKNTPHALGSLSPNRDKEFMIDAGERSEQYLEGCNEKLQNDNEYDNGENSRLISSPSSQASSVMSLHRSLGEDKENNTVGHFAVKTNQDQTDGSPEDQLKVAGVKRKFGESDTLDVIQLSGLARNRKRSRVSGWLFTCGSNLEEIS